jgi:anion-transporting  ArsA/GET3 family ATPase
VSGPPTQASAAAAHEALDRVLREKRVLVLCGAGGVGKTTTAAALALRAALLGRRVLVLTVDPARRLAQAMGIDAGGSTPTPVPASQLAAEGLPPVTLEAWMLAPNVVLERMVQRVAPSAAAAARLTDNRLYRALGELVAGMQEYAAAEATYGFVTEGRYELVVLDTPPSRHALDFLDAPGRLTRFVDERILSLFSQEGAGHGRLWRRAQALVTGVLETLFGKVFTGEMREFLGAFAPLLGALRLRSERLRELLASPDAAFLLVASPEEAALAEADYFGRSLRERGMPLAGVVLNRSWARSAGLVSSARLPLAPDASPAQRAARDRLAELGTREEVRAEEHSRLLARLAREVPLGAFALATPELGAGPDTLAGLAALVAPES